MGKALITIGSLAMVGVIFLSYFNPKLIPVSFQKAVLSALASIAAGCVFIGGLLFFTKGQYWSALLATTAGFAALRAVFLLVKKKPDEPIDIWWTVLYGICLIFL